MDTALGAPPDVGADAIADVATVLKDRSHRSIAVAVGCDKSHVSMILSGRRNPSTDMLRAMARHLGLSMDALDQHLVQVRQQAVQAT